MVASQLLACAATQLNSERIEERFGSYAVTVISQDARFRITSLESVEGDRPVTRTLALVRFADAMPPELAAVDARIRNGASIGASFRDAGFAIDKPLLYLGEVRVGSDATALASMMQIPVPASLAVHVYRFEVRRGRLRYRYASIAEVHHPAYLDLAELRSIYGAVPDTANTVGGLLDEVESLLPRLPRDLAR